MMIEDMEDQLIEQELEGVGVENLVAPPPSRPAPKRGRFRTNLISNGALFGFNLLIGLWYTPYLIHHLGMAGYGIIPLVRQIVGFMTVITAGLNAAVGRYITIALERGEEESANRYFNTSLFGSVILALLLVIPAGWASLHVELLINVPPGDVFQTRWLFACVAVVFLLNAVRTPFAISTYSLNRFDLTNYLSAINRLVSIGVVVVCFNIATPQIWNVGLGLVMALVFTWIGTVWFWRRLTPQLRIAVSHFDLGTLRSLVSLGGWVSINIIGATLYLSIDLLVVNRMIGPEAGGRYAAVAQWSALLRTMAGTIVGLFGPTMLYYYARHDIDGLARYGQQAVKLVGLMMALPIGLICGLSVPLLQTWLGPDFADLNWLMSLMTIHLSVNLAVSPLYSVQTVTNCVRTPAIVTLATGVGNLALAILLAGPIGWGVYGVAAAGAITLTAKNLIFSPIYAAYVLRIRWNAFLSKIFPIVLATTGLAGVGKVLSTTWDISGWFHLAASGAVMSVAYAVVGYYVLLNREERLLAWSMIPKSVAIGRGK